MADDLESVWLGKDYLLLDKMLEYYAPTAKLIVDVSCNTRRMWRGSLNAERIICLDNNISVAPDIVANWGRLPLRDVDILIYDPPHLPKSAVSAKSLASYKHKYGLENTTDPNLPHLDFLAEATRVLKLDGLIFAKIKDYINRNCYQWNLEYFLSCARMVGLTPCDLIIKRDPSGGQLRSKWKNRYHAKNVHTYWLIIRNGNCYPRRRS